MSGLSLSLAILIGSIRQQLKKRRTDKTKQSARSADGYHVRKEYTAEQISRYMHGQHTHTERERVVHLKMFPIMPERK
jgi:hypothetical protein